MPAFDPIGVVPIPARNLPQQLTFIEFARAAMIKPLINHGRKAEVFFEGESLGFVDALGDGGLRQAHKREVNNALYWASPDTEASSDVFLPSVAALAEYPELVTLYSEAAALVQSAPPEGWSESEPGGLATNVDLIYGGIVDCTIQNGEWFVVPHLEGLPVLEGFKTRSLAFDALNNAIEHSL
ncbi:hypothetical protein R6242_16235 [Iodobacter sp. CM08]|uniref:hypothetical protein n=1 Tax=Iodobacter sp. CM08 TaxID=3085902 RepID=UPI002981032D|nr:hypothetical protein [Iodobacter sp. CM08]MDW5418116.1 hypothetical protein [Iodobacter sp. CM08]